jgi:hypothetical protein
MEAGTMRGRALALMLVLGSILPTSTFPQKAAPDLSGSWKLDTTKTAWDAVNSLEWKIKQDGDRIAVDITADRIKNRLEYITDGKPRVAGVDPVSNTKIIARASWEGRDLVLVSELQDKKQPVLTSRFSLSANGKVLSVRRTMGDLDKTFVFEKQ